MWSHLRKKSLMENFIFCAVTNHPMDFTNLANELGVLLRIKKTFVTFQNMYQLTSTNYETLTAGIISVDNTFDCAIRTTDH